MTNLPRTLNAITTLLRFPRVSKHTFTKNQTQVRLQSICATKLLYTENGEPVEVIKQVEEKLDDKIKPKELLLKMLAAPINPADINTIQGKYPAAPPLPAVPGNEGVATIVKIGSEVKELKVGDHVIPLAQGLGTWRTHLVMSEDCAFKVPKELGLVEAATLTVNPCTAFRMLRDFVNLKPGDTVIQNGANSACGQYVIQLCRAWGLNSVNIVRNRPNLDELKAFLKKLGANYVLTEEEVRTTTLFKSGELKKPRLALNCVGGKSALEIMRLLESKGSMVTYGGMSREPVTVPTSALIFKDVRILGYWMTRWSKENYNSEERFEMFDELITMMMHNEMQGAACELIPFDQYKEALGNALNMKGMVGKKYIFEFDHDD